MNMSRIFFLIFFGVAFGMISLFRDWVNCSTNKSFLVHNKNRAGIIPIEMMTATVEQNSSIDRRFNRVRGTPSLVDL